MGKNLESVSGLRDLFYNTRAGRIAILGTAICLGVVLTSYSCNMAERYSKLQIQQGQVLGTEKPEIYIEHKGVRYFSHVDGKEISDLVK